MQSEAGKTAQHVSVPQVKAANLGLVLGPHGGSRTDRVPELHTCPAASTTSPENK